MRVLLVCLALLIAPVAMAADANLIWDASWGADGYKVLYRTAPSEEFPAVDTCPPPRCVDVGNVTEYDWTGLPDQAELHFAVRAYNAAGDSGLSNEAVLPLPEFPPSPPEGVSATKATAEVRIEPDGTVVASARVERSD